MSYDYRTLDDVIHSRVRLAIMSFLATAEQSEFNALKKILKVSDGNLSTHLRKLEEVSYVQIKKSFKDRKPLTTIAVTDTGREAFKTYVDGLSAMIEPAETHKSS